MVRASSISPWYSGIDAIEGQGRILFVTGDPGVRDLLYWTFTLAQLDFVCVATDQFLHPEWIARCTLYPPVRILLDLDQDPVDVTRTFYAHWRTTSSSPVPPVIVLTTHAEKCKELEGIREGPTVFTKPFHPQELIEAIATMPHGGIG